MVPGTQLNYAEHIFRGKADDEVALLYASERRELTELRSGELRERVAATREGLRALGVSKGDRVVAYLPNGAEALIAFLASATLGAIWSSCSLTSAPAASSTASPRSSRRSSSPSTGTATAARTSTAWTPWPRSPNRSRASSGSWSCPT